ncbi:hypothetical protein B566_EDAN004093 [Ephemera danica]|nr:hypothetical protein B566_EDAN004093 [Ephemera danica]
MYDPCGVSVNVYLLATCDTILLLLLRSATAVQYKATLAIRQTIMVEQRDMQQVKYPQHRDSGIYECQISTTPHMSHFIHLNVVGIYSKAVIL